jgi:DNA-binding HxlR family transcriptional regulator
MKRSELGDLTCSLAGSLAEIGDAWSLLIVKELMLKNRRFDGIAAQMGVSDSSLAERLKRLERAGIIQRHPYQTRPVRYEYRLTRKGEDLWPALVALTRWGDRWQRRGAPPLTFGCACCNTENTTISLACDACGTPLDPRSVVVGQSEEMLADRARRARER